MSLKIIEGGTLKTTVLAEVTLPTTDVDVGIDKIGLTSVDFVSNVKFKHDHSGIASTFYATLG
jgi:hypothetical protein